MDGFFTHFNTYGISWLTSYIKDTKMTTIHRFITWVKGFWLFWWVQKETHEPEPVNYGDRPPVGYDGNDPFNWYT